MHYLFTAFICGNDKQGFDWWSFEELTPTNLCQHPSPPNTAQEWGLVVVTSCSSCKDGSPEMLNLISPGKGSEWGWAGSSIRAGSPCTATCKPASQVVLEGRINSTELFWFSLWWWHSGFAVLHKEAKALSKSHLCLKCFYNLSSWGPQKTPQENQITWELPELSTSAHFCISWKSTIPYRQPLQWRHVKVSEVFTILFKIMLSFQAVHTECCTNSSHSPACLSDRGVFEIKGGFFWDPHTLQTKTTFFFFKYHLPALYP